MFGWNVSHTCMGCCGADRTLQNNRPMEIKVDQSIKELLYEHPVVIVPGLGGFTREQGMAVLDYVQGMIFPPGSKLAFKPNLVTNDGLLTHKIQDNYTVSASEATDAIGRFVKNIRQMLANREIVEIPGVGRIYQDYEQQLRFLPEGENFNPDAFGLPGVSFTPLVRERVTARPNGAGDSPAVDRPAPAASKLPLRLQRAVPWLVVLAALLLAVWVYRYVLEQGAAGVPVAGASEPVAMDPVGGASEADDREAEVGMPEAESPLHEDMEVASTAIAGVPSGPSETGTTVFLVVHSFGVRANATRFAAELSAAGFAAETQKVDQLYRVGILFRYQDARELENMRKELGSRFNAAPKTGRELDEQLGK